MTRVAVIGAGSWGTAVAAIVAGNVDTTLVGAAPGAAPPRSRPTTRTPTYLPGIALADDAVAPPRHSRTRAAAPTSSCSASRRTACARCSPTPGPFVAPGVPIVSLAKGIEQGTLARMTEVAGDVLVGHDPVTDRRAHRAEPRA